MTIALKIVGNKNYQYSSDDSEERTTTKITPMTGMLARNLLV